MAVPTQLSDLSETAASNSPAGTDTVGTTMDDYIRAHASIIARIAAGTDKIAPAGVTGTAAILGANTFTGLQIASLGLTVSGADFNSRGITDSATAKALTLSGSGANSVTIANSATNPTIGTSAGALLLGGGTGTQSVVVGINVGADYLVIQGQSTLPYIYAEGASVNISTGLSAKGTGSLNFYTNGAAQLQMQVLHIASAVNRITMQGAATATNVAIYAAGTDANIGFNLQTKGTGILQLGSLSGNVITCQYGGANHMTVVSNAANPKISTSAGSLDIGAPVVFTGQTVGTTVGAAGGASALPATPLGYLTTSVNGSACKIPYYN